MNRLNNNTKTLFEKQDEKSIAQVIERFNYRNDKLEQLLSSKDTPEHLKGLSKEYALLKILSHKDFYSIMNIGYYEACNENNPIIFLNALFTYSRLNFEMMKLLGSGTDHCIYFPSVVEHFASNDFDRAKEIYNLELDISKSGHRFAKCVTNLITAILHKDETLIKKSTIIAEKYLLLKNPNFDKSTVEFLLSITRKDYENANSSFAEICKLYKKVNWLHDFKNPFLKEIGIFPIGLFKLAEYYAGHNQGGLNLPENDILWKDFISLKERGKSYIHFTHKLEGLNDFLK